MANHSNNYYQKKWENFRRTVFITMSIFIVILFTGIISKIGGGTIRTTLLQSIAGFIFWTTTLTPYMLFVVKTRGRQYWKWVAMQLAIIPILAPLSILFTNWFIKSNIAFWV